MIKCPSECGLDMYQNMVVGFSVWHDRAGNRLFERHLHREDRSYRYEHDAAGRLTKYQRGKLYVDPTAPWPPVPPTPVTPPAISQPLSLSGADKDVELLLDHAGNWDFATYTPAVGGTSTDEDRIHGDANQLLKRRVAGPVEQYKYDGNGNLTEDHDENRRYVYDPLNRLKQVRPLDDNSESAIIASYYYDALGRRVKKVLGNPTSSTSMTAYLYAGQQCVEERDDSGDVLRQYVWGQYVDELVQQRDYLPDNKTEDYYPVSDLTWSAVALTDNKGCIKEAYDIDAYGRTLVFNASGAEGWFTDNDVLTTLAPKCRHLFTGREFDAESGLYYFRARHYSPTLGRFLQRDPLAYDAGDMNLYAYCCGNPLLQTDPTGEIVGVDDLIIIGGIIALTGALLHQASSAYQRPFVAQEIQANNYGMHSERFENARWGMAVGSTMVAAGTAVFTAPVLGAVAGFVPGGGYILGAGSFGALGYEGYSIVTTDYTGWEAIDYFEQFGPLAGSLIGGAAGARLFRSGYGSGLAARTAALRGLGRGSQLLAEYSATARTAALRRLGRGSQFLAEYSATARTAALRGLGRGLQLLDDYVPRLKPLRDRATGRETGWTFSQGRAYGSRARFEYHTLPNGPRIPSWARGRVRPHWHRRGPGGIARHRPFETRPNEEWYEFWKWL